jgi:hypothetical protein
MSTREQCSDSKALVDSGMEEFLLPGSGFLSHCGGLWSPRLFALHSQRVEGFQCR